MTPTIRNEVKAWEQANAPKRVIGEDESGVWFNAPLPLGGGETTGLIPWNKFAYNLGGVVALPIDDRTKE